MTLLVNLYTILVIPQTKTQLPFLHKKEVKVINLLQLGNRDRK